MYGTVLPWAHEPDGAGQVRAWAVHSDEIRRQGTEWAQLRQTHPDIPLAVAGDFNQDRDGSGWYGTRRVRDELTAALANAGLEVVTGRDVVAAGLLAKHHLVDHIALSRDVVDGVSVSCWEPTDDDGVRLSDHPTVAVDVPLLTGSEHAGRIATAADS